ncbi:hypothetical protein C943_01972 [Mariniradius saccharolyticus AK6]|uniref:Uncharacterized protein n=1 Tax=Mariniradius saccharolyticus AK6 TaxID=1239962 RepID=M7Y3A5_9BACT|nr:hypothetical protein C943_01972 [Mariniradius saccharolyticus AK6]
MDAFNCVVVPLYPTFSKSSRASLKIHKQLLAAKAYLTF